ncbi:unnamed protein product [Closterium sp. Naga37s-1]|nr:unnamed protein product [Closterium sp. Naga37s-1]
MHGRVGDGPRGAGACFVGGLLSIPAPTSRHSFRYSGPRPPPSGQTRTATTESDSEADDEEEEDEEGDEEEAAEDEEGSRDDSEQGWTPETHGGGGGGGDEDEEMEGLEPEGGEEEGVGEGGGVAAEEAFQHVGRGSGRGGVKFRKLLILCNHHYGQKNFIPSRWTVAHDIVVFVAAALQAAIAELLAKEGDLGCKVSYSIDMWTAPNSKAWLVVTGHWIDESFQLCMAVLDFCELTGRHTGREMAQVVEETVVLWGLQGRCLGLTSDNASSNIAAFRRLSGEGGGRGFFNSRLHLRCLSHVINLAVQGTLSEDAICDLLKVLRDMASWIGYSPQRSAAFLGIQRSLNLQARVNKPALKLVQDSPTRWGSTHAMADRVLLLQNPITVFFASTQPLILTPSPMPCRTLNPDRAAKADKEKVEKLRLSDEQWELLLELMTFLSPFNKVSKAAKGTAYPTVSMVVPYYIGLIDAMESRLAKGPSATLRPMIVKALDLLKKYTYITSNEHWIATFLNPSMKAAWFDDDHWGKLHPWTERRERPRPASSDVIALVRERVAEYQAAARELAPRPTTLALVVEEQEGEGGDDDDDQYLPSRRRIAARLSASQAAGGGGGGGGGGGWACAG